MFSDDEDELELLRQYGEKDLNADDSDAHSSDMDSDLEDKIMSMVQYGSGLSKKNTTPIVSPVADKQVQTEIVAPKVVYAPVDKKAETKKTNFSAANLLQISSDEEEEDQYHDTNNNMESDEEDIGVLENPPTPPTVMEEVVEPKVTRYINLDEKHYMEDEETSDEETELGIKLQELIDDQISKRQSKSRYINKPLRICFGCQQPGHERRDCTLCADCGGLKHSEGRCVGSRYCTRCKLRGHNAADCENDREIGSCRICHMSYHAAENCPSLLHVYMNEKIATKKPTAYCYYCTSKGHYGDECPSLPNYLTTMPSVFSYLSLSEGSRFDPKKTMKSSASSFGLSKQSSNHQRWSDNGRESSPRRGNIGYNNDRGYNNSNKKRRYNDDSDDEYGSRNDYRSGKKYNDRYDDSDNDRKKKKTTSYKDNSAGGKRRRTDLDDSRSSSRLDNFFTSEKKNGSSSGNGSGNKKKGGSSYNNSGNTHNSNNAGKSGNNNWKAMNNNSLPLPTRSGTVNMNSSSSSSSSSKNKGRQQQQQQQQQRQNYDGDFPRGNNDVPRPSSSGVIDLTKSDSNNNGGYSKRTPKYHGGYNRNR